MSIDYRGKKVWITGASSGIGEALAYEFARQGAILILSARRKETLEKVAIACRQIGSTSFVYCVDQSQSSDTEEVADRLLKEFGTIDVLVNNGGISQRSLILETPVEIDRQIMEIDFFSGVILSKKVLPGMVGQKFGHIVVISSITGIFGFPQRSAYSAAKHAILGFYETLWAELHEEGIRVTMVCPGRIRTNISLSALTKDGLSYGIMDHAQNSGLSASACARKIMNAVKKNKIVVYIGRKELLMVYLKKYMPWLFYKLVSNVKPN